MSNITQFFLSTAAGGDSDVEEGLHASQLG